MIHVAGVIDETEAGMLIGCGVRYLGLPLVLDHHAQDLSVADAAGIVRRFGDAATFFVITYLASEGDIAALCEEVGVRTVQLHGEVPVRHLEQLKARAPRLRIIKSLIVGRAEEPDLIELMQSAAPYVDSFITDTFDPSTGASGATGKVHDWTVSRRIVEAAGRPVILAGGLTPENVGAAIDQVRPAGVDVHTGIEGPDGRKDEVLTRRFVAEARAGLKRMKT